MATTKRPGKIALRVAIVAIVVMLYLGPWRAPGQRRYDA
jgi:hypothetical protein